MADGKIVIDARINKKQAEADLRALKAEAASTARQIAAVDKQISSASAKKLKLEDSLKAARQAAEATAESLDALKAKMSLDKQYEALLARNEALTNTLAQQDEKVQRLSSDYQQFLSMRDKVGDNFTPEQAAASERANADYKSRLAAARAEAEATAAQLERVNIQLDQMQQKGAGVTNAEDTKNLDALNAKLEKQQATVNQIEAEYKQQEATVDALNNKHTALNETLAQQQAAVKQQSEQISSLPDSGSSDTTKALTGTTKRLGLASKAASLFGKRLLRLTAAAFVFNLISKGLQVIVKGMGNALMQTQSVSTAFSRLKATAATAAAGLANALAPVITKLINMVTALLNVFIRLISFVTGQSIGAMKKQGQAITSTGAAAKKAAKSLAAFDEINRLDDNSSSGGGSGADFSAVGEGVSKLSGRMKELAEQFKAGFKKGFGDAGEGLKNIQADLARIGDTLKEIWTDPAVSAAVKRFTNTCAYALGEVVGAAASIGVSIAENLVGGMARYLERSKGFLKKTLANVFNLGSDLVGLFGDFAAAVATVFRSLGSEGAKQLTSGFIGILANSALGMIQTVEQIAYAIAKPLLQPFIDNAEKIREVFANLFTVIAPFFVGISDGLAAFFSGMGDVYNAVIKPMIDGLAAFNSGVLGALLDKLNAFLETLTGTADLLHGLGEVIGFVAGGLLTAFTVVQTGTAIFNIAKTAITGVSAAFTAARSAVSLLPAAIGALTSPFGIAVIAIGAVIAAGVALYTHWDDLKAAAGTLYDALYQYGQDLYTNMQTLKQNVADSFAQIKQNLNDWGHSMQESWNTFWANIWLKLQTFGAQIQAGFQAIWTTVQTIFSGFCSAAQATFSGFVSTIQAGLNALKGVFSSIWNGIVGIVQGAISRIISGVVSMVERITSAINGILSALSSMGSRVASGISSAREAISSHSLADGPALAVAGLDSLPVPALATGAVIPPNRKFLAMLGDQTGGTNVEAPLSTIKQAMAEVLASAGGTDDGQPINIYIGEELLDSVIANSERRRTLRSGGR